MQVFSKKTKKIVLNGMSQIISIVKGHYPKFDSSGIWKFKDILFSRHGNLKDTFFYFVDNSDAGLRVKKFINWHYES